MWDGFNKRRFPRLAVPCEITLLGEVDGKPIKTVTENIGAGGVAVVLKKQYERFSKCRIKLKLDDKFPAIESFARIAWTIRTKAKNKAFTYDTGIEFVDLKLQDFTLLKKFISDRVR